MKKAKRKIHLFSLVGILIFALCSATATAIIQIPANTTAGTWNPLTRTYTLTQDVNDTIEITESDLTLNGNNFSINGAGAGRGVSMQGGSYINRVDVNVVNLTINNFYEGIYAKYSSYITLKNNTITNCPEGIMLIYVKYSNITGNNISESIYHGIFFNTSKYNTLTENTFANNNYGLYADTYSNYNTIYNNNFICNIYQAASLNTANTFNLDAPTGGNHWSDWGGPDDDGDGFVDLPYVFYGGTDYLPFVVENGWANTPPVADAGDDQVIIQLASLVQLDGSGSFDLEGDPMSYEWTIIEKPLDSTAELSNPYSVTPTFVADLHGNYVIQLVVSDPYSSSAPDSVTISFENVKPVADAGQNQSVIVGSTVALDGSESYDANYDLLTCLWSFVSVPQGSSASLSDPTSVQPTFVADLPGEYVVSLVVNDGFEDSSPATVSIMTVTNQQLATQALIEASEVINLLEPENFKNKNMKNPLTHKISQVLDMIDRGFYVDALNKLNNDVLKKIDGCADNGSPDKNDWITTCDGQAQVYPIVVEAISYLEAIVQ